MTCFMPRCFGLMCRMMIVDSPAECLNRYLAFWISRRSGQQMQSGLAEAGGKRSDFEILWKSGDITWAPYREAAHLVAMQSYCEVMGVRRASDLPVKHLP